MALAKKRVKVYKHKPTPEDIVRDPSLRWFAYKRWECVWCEVLGKLVRFYDYQQNGAMIQIAEMDSMHVLTDSVPASSVWRSRTY